MYGFTKLDGGALISPVSSVGLIFNGIDLESIIPGFRTLSIKGRGMIGRTLEIVKRLGGDGDVLLSSNLPSRTIGVKYVLESKDNTGLRKAFERLNAILHTKEEVSISFRDDTTCYYKGILETSGEEEETSNIIKGELVFYCPTPFKYKLPVTKTGVNPVFNSYGGNDPKDSGVAGLFANFSFTSNVNAPNVRIQNSKGQFIELGPVVSGKTYKLILHDRISIFENSFRKMSLLKITAGVENFQIEPGISFSLSTGGNISVEFTEVRL